MCPRKGSIKKMTMIGLKIVLLILCSSPEYRDSNHENDIWRMCLVNSRTHFSTRLIVLLVFVLLGLHLGQYTFIVSILNWVRSRKIHKEYVCLHNEYNSVSGKNINKPQLKQFQSLLTFQSEIAVHFWCTQRYGGSFLIFLEQDYLFVYLHYALVLQ